MNGERGKLDSKSMNGNYMSIPRLQDHRITNPWIFDLSQFKTEQLFLFSISLEAAENHQQNLRVSGIPLSIFTHYFFESLQKLSSYAELQSACESVFLVSLQDVD